MNFTDHFLPLLLESAVSLSFGQLFILSGKFSDIVCIMFFQVQKRGQKEKNVSLNETRQLAMTTEKVAAMLLQILDENTNTEVQNT